jgi:hypothetical protein
MHIRGWKQELFSLQTQGVRGARFKQLSGSVFLCHRSDRFYYYHACTPYLGLSKKDLRARGDYYNDLCSMAFVLRSFLTPLRALL